jgi:hypothetical protein
MASVLNSRRIARRELQDKKQAAGHPEKLPSSLEQALRPAAHLSFHQRLRALYA